MIVAILNQKGGSGKTTISINLARCFKLRGDGKVLLVDSDPQGSARDWNVAGEGEILNVVAMDRPTLPKDILCVRHDYDWVFIDGAPSLAAMAMAAIKCADIILIPVQPSPYDLWATEDLAQLVMEQISWTGGKTRAAFVISRQIPNTIIGREIRDILIEYKVSHGISTFEHGTFQRVIYSTSAATGKTVFESNDAMAALEVGNLANELKEFAV